MTDETVTLRRLIEASVEQAVPLLFHVDPDATGPMASRIACEVLQRLADLGIEVVKR